LTPSVSKHPVEESPGRRVARKRGYSRRRRRENSYREYPPSSRVGTIQGYLSKSSPRRLSGLIPPHIQGKRGKRCKIEDKKIRKKTSRKETMGRGC